jgi:hypothetical protein
MQCVRLFTGDDSQSHFEDMDMSETGGFLFATHPVTGLVFKNDPATRLGDFHNAPRRQYCITLSGSAKIAVGDGTSRTFRAGDVFLAEDVTGQGHTVVPDNWARAFVHLD